MTSTQVSSVLSEKLTRNHMELLRNKAVIPGLAHNLIIHFISFEELSYVDCQNVAQYTIKTSQYIFRINPLAW